MKACVYTGHGGPETESLADVPRPEPGPGQLPVAVERLVEDGHTTGKVVAEVAR